MKFNYSRQHIAMLLFAISVLFITANITADYLLPAKKNNLKEMDRESVDSLFSVSLKNLGIKEEWVKKLNPKEEGVISYRITTPTDLPIPVILNEINMLLEGADVTLQVTEKGINGRTSFQIYAPDEKRLHADFEYNPDITRAYNRGAVILTGVEGLSDLERSLLLSLPEQMAFTVIPDKNSPELIRQIKESGKEYIVYLNDEISDLEFKLKPGFSQKRIAEVLSAIAGKFKDASFIMIDDGSNLYNSDEWQYVMKEIDQRKILLFKYNQASILTGDAEQISSTFMQQMLSAGGGEPEIFITEAVHYSDIRPGVIKLRKVGHKIINPSMAVKQKLTATAVHPSD